MMKTSKSTFLYGIVGDGRLARHLFHYFSKLSIPCVQWSRSSAELGVTVEDALAKCDSILVVIRDDAIEPFILAHPSLKSKTLIHCSGCLTTPLAIGVHPLMTFGPDLYGIDFYRRIPFVVEKTHHGDNFKSLFPDLPNPHFEIDSHDKDFYHSLCVLASNCTVLLWQKFFNEMHLRWAIPKKSLLPYLERTFQNLIKNPNGALTGPFQRRDRGTVQRNLDALRGDPYQNIYRAFAELVFVGVAGDLNDNP